MDSGVKYEEFKINKFYLFYPIKLKRYLWINFLAFAVLLAIIMLGKTQ